MEPSTARPDLNSDQRAAVTASMAPQLVVPGPATTSWGSIEAVTAARWSAFRSGQSDEVTMRSWISIKSIPGGIEGLKGVRERQNVRLAWGKEKSASRHPPSSRYDVHRIASGSSLRYGASTSSSQVVQLSGCSDFPMGSSGGPHRASQAARLS